MKLNQVVTKEEVCTFLGILPDSSYEKMIKTLFNTGSKLYVEWEIMQVNAHTLSIEHTGVGLVKKSPVYLNQNTGKTEDNK